MKMQADADRSPARAARLPDVKRKPSQPQSAVNWPALLVLWAIALALVFFGQ